MMHSSLPITNEIVLVLSENDAARTYETLHTNSL